MNLDLYFPTPVWHTKLNFNSYKLLDLFEEISMLKGKSLSNKGGYQSQDFFRDEFECTKEFSLAVEDEVRICARDMGIQPPLINNLWFNYNTSDHDTNTIHNHPGSILSGVYYLEADDTSGPLCIHRDFDEEMYLGYCLTTEVSHLNACTAKYAPEKDKLIIFPSNILHSVSANRATGKRISISFNMGYRYV